MYMELSVTWWPLFRFIGNEANRNRIKILVDTGDTGLELHVNEFASSPDQYKSEDCIWEEPKITRRPIIKYLKIYSVTSNFSKGTTSVFGIRVRLFTALYAKKLQDSLRFINKRN